MYSYVTLIRFIAKTNYWGEDTSYCPYHTISNSRPVMCHSVSQSDQRIFSEHVWIHLHFLTLNNWNLARCPAGTFHSPFSTLTLTLHTHTTITPTLHNPTVLNRL